MSSDTPGVLAKILHATREELQRRKRDVPQQALEARLEQLESCGEELSAPGNGPSRSLRAALTAQASP